MSPEGIDSLNALASGECDFHASAIELPATRLIASGNSAHSTRRGKCVVMVATRMRPCRRRRNLDRIHASECDREPPWDDFLCQERRIM